MARPTPDYKDSWHRQLFEHYAIGAQLEQSANNDTRDPPGIGNWPRRLLHVPTMTSYEWQPGNLYGQHREPQYNAISYTWGRWRLDSRSAPEQKLEKGDPPGEARGLVIYNIEWDIPLIDPEHFTPEQFRAALSQATTRFYSRSDEQDAEFLWLDVACIDQRWNSEDGALEVGRQAAIFRGADEVFIWLNRSGFERLSELAAGIASNSLRLFVSSSYEATASSETAKAERLKAVQDLDSYFKELFQDPWFTSLWTLQEAFLCQNAHLLSRNAMPISIAPLDGLRPLIRLCDDLSNYCTKADTPDTPHVPGSPWDVALRDLHKTLHSRGLPALASNNPLAAYCAAASRQATDQSDYVYGVQQVFHYRLGKTQEGSNTTQKLSRRHLESQFGARLIEDWPVLSQMHVFTVPARLGTGWHPSLDSRIPSGPGWSRLTSTWWWKLECLCDIRATSADEGAVGAFRGRVCQYAAMQGLWSMAESGRDSDDSHGTRSRPSEPESLHHIGLDVTLSIGDVEDPSEPPEYRTRGYARDILPGSEQKALTLWLTEYFGNHLKILLLGRIVDDLEGRTFQDETYNIGLLLTESDGDEFDSAFRRIGFCYWRSDPLPAGMEDVQPMLAAFDTHPFWRDLEGHFI